MYKSRIPVSLINIPVEKRKLTVERHLPGWKGVNRCSQCQEDGVFTPATHGVVDSIETPDGDWKEGKARFGCFQHGVVPMIFLKEGGAVTFEQYTRGENGNPC